MVNKSERIFIPVKRNCCNTDLKFCTSSPRIHELKCTRNVCLCSRSLKCGVRWRLPDHKSNAFYTLQTQRRNILGNKTHRSLQRNVLKHRLRSCSLSSYTPF